MQSLTGGCNLPHEGRRCLQVPVGVGDMGVTEVGAERDDMAANGVAIRPTLLQRADGEGVSQIVNTRSRLTGLPSQAG